MSNFVELLITEVERRPILWNRYLKDYKNRVLVEKEWENVALVLQKEKYKVKQKWKNLRDQFQRECKKIRSLQSGVPGSLSAETYNVKWAHFEQMKFYLKIMSTPFPTEMSFHVDQIKEEQIDISEDTPSQDSNTVLEEDTPPASITPSCAEKGFESITGSPLSEFEKQFIELENRKMRFLMDNSMASTSQENSQDDEDMLFVKSLVPFFKNLPPLKKLIVRNKIQEVLIAEMRNEENDKLNNFT
ncbi:uncharacterized protein LOC128897083 [Hylaeus anthracinus]|uniref:uncharacterized protein LOC128897083 n=1 Tax=Hylaeus anthracinus TaxID=313031 RepID=UPI0023BA3A2A|nr:uncharacterized protein LOC128897083 [Hylaeus anthracinus]